MLRYCLLIILLCGCHLLQAQLFDDFSDGDFSQNPAWTGDTEFFQISTDFQLQTNGPDSAQVLHLVTPSTRVDATEWRFRLVYNNPPSTSNLMRVYLISDQADLEGPLNGYFIGIGETGSDDSIDLFRQDGNTLVKIVDGPDATVGRRVNAHIRVLRDEAGNWEVYADPENGENFALQGSVVDATHTTSAYFGVYVKHTSSRRDAFFFDDIYVGNQVVDQAPPALVQAEIVAANQLDLLFSEPLNPQSVLNVGHYEMDNGIGNPLTAQLDASNPALVHLVFAVDFQNNTTYLLRISGIEDVSGNALAAPLEVSLTYFVPDVAAFKDVIINEIFPDPTPPLGLPNAEYIELYNRSDKTFELQGWTFDNGTTTGSLPAYVLAPGAYLILTREQDVSAFESFGTAIGPSSWPSLVNSGDNLSLMDHTGALIDRVDYLQSWYGDATKAQGGYALELINPEQLLCPAKTNWTASVSPSGGTPGKVNSVFSMAADTQPPALLGVEVLDETHLQLCFDESMDPASLEEPAHYSIDQGLGSPLAAEAVAPDFECVILTLSQPVQPGIIYSLAVDRVADCSQNLPGDVLQASFVQGLPAAAFEIVINEIFPDPDPQLALPEAEFVEVVNRTAKVLDMSGWSLSDGRQSAQWGAATLMPGEYAILCHEQDAADFRPFGKVIASSTFPSLGNTTDTLYLRNELGLPMDYLFYHRSWFRNASKEQGGWTLEKIDPDFVNCNQAGNWGASVDATGGTPGRANSIAGTFVDNQPPAINGILVESETITLFFSEQMDEGSISDAGRYTLNGGIGQPFLAFPVPPTFTAVQLLLSTPLQQGQVYELSFSELEDCAGNAISGRRGLGIPQTPRAGEVRINEILFNPYSGGADFVEIYNASQNVLDLSQIYIGNDELVLDPAGFNGKPITALPLFLLPGELLCLTEDTLVQRQLYLPPSHAALFEVDDLPSFPDTEGSCLLFTYSNGGLQDTLDFFSYLDDYHFPTLDDVNGVSLERISLEAPTQNPDNWHSAASTVHYATPGYENSQSLEPVSGPSAVSLEKQSFSPNGDGVDDVLTINYDFDFPGANARITIFDSHGRPIRQLRQNTLLSPQAGSFFWDGRDEKNTKADVGIYVVLFEVTNQQSGEKQLFKLACVLADVF